MAECHIMRQGDGGLIDLKPIEQCRVIEWLEVVETATTVSYISASRLLNGPLWSIITPYSSRYVQTYQGPTKPSILTPMIHLSYSPEEIRYSPPHPES